MITLALILATLLVFCVLGLAFKIVCAIFSIALMPVKFILGAVFSLIGVILLITFGAVLIIPCIVLLIVYLISKAFVRF